MILPCDGIRYSGTFLSYLREVSLWLGKVVGFVRLDWQTCWLQWRPGCKQPLRQGQSIPWSLHRGWSTWYCQSCSRCSFCCRRPCRASRVWLSQSDSRWCDTRCQNFLALLVFLKVPSFSYFSSRLTSNSSPQTSLSPGQVSGHIKLSSALTFLMKRPGIQRAKKTGLLVPTLVYISRRKGFLVRVSFF